MSAAVLYDVLHDPVYRSKWDHYMLEIKDIGHINPNNSISYYACKSHCGLENVEHLARPKQRWVEVVAQLVEWSLLTPEARGSNLVIGKLFYTIFICLPVTVLKRRKETKKTLAHL